MAFFYHPFESLTRDFDEDLFWPFGSQQQQQRIGGSGAGTKAVTSKQSQGQQMGVTRPRMDW